MGKAVKYGPADVRTNAIYAVRSWLLKWPTISARWTPEEIQMGNEIIRLPAFRDEVYKAIPSEDPNSGTQDLRGIQMTPAYRCLIYSQDPRALGIVKKALAKNAWTKSEWIRDLGYLPGPKTAEYLFDLIDETVKISHPQANQQQDYEAEQVIGFAGSSLHQIGVKDYSRALVHVNNPKLAPVLRVAVAGVITRVGTEPIYQSVKSLILEPDFPDWAKSNLIYRLNDYPHPDVDAFLRTLEKESKSEVVRISATNALRIRTRREG